MHTVSRHANEGIVIGDDIHVTVLNVYADRVRLAISSPRDVPSYWEQTVYVEQPETAGDVEMREPLSVGPSSDWSD